MDMMLLIEKEFRHYPVYKLISPGIDLPDIIHDSYIIRRDLLKEVIPQYNEYH